MKEGFPPIADARATVLILGTMPSEESLRKKQYYGNPRNAFWKIMGRLLKFERAAIYEERTEILKNNKIALWDVMQSCERQGSLDSAIINSTIIENDFVSFYRSHPNIRQVFFNGTKAEKEYCKRVLPKLSVKTKDIEYSRLPSTSPAMAHMSFDVKLLEWSAICEVRRAI
ncbi:DNA-deoxyinosine glycosylase [Candidatus Spongiihabitans sp.]|uniref:DNA-deoxyinosine glycosylase n=1 Tax=Candidatus Spongiihabitans sp. TaxID=3101308 RepID=UPI003C6F5BA7